jgi:hypothetical protein
MNDETRKVLTALKDEHEAIDWLLARLCTLDRTFFPSESPIWPTVERGAALLREMETQDQ